MFFDVTMEYVTNGNVWHIQIVLVHNGMCAKKVVFVYEGKAKNLQLQSAVLKKRIIQERRIGLLALGARAAQPGIRKIEKRMDLVGVQPQDGFVSSMKIIMVRHVEETALYWVLVEVGKEVMAVVTMEDTAQSGDGVLGVQIIFRQ